MSEPPHIWIALHPPFKWPADSLLVCVSSRLILAQHMIVLNIFHRLISAFYGKIPAWKKDQCLPWRNTISNSGKVIKFCYVVIDASFEGSCFFTDQKFTVFICRNLIHSDNFTTNCKMPSTGEAKNMQQRERRLRKAATSDFLEKERLRKVKF